MVERLCDRADEFGVIVKNTRSGATLIDAGIEANGGLSAGKIIIEICLGGHGNASIFYKQYGDLELPSIFVYTDHPAISTLASQFAGWRIKVGKYFAMASGPGRVLSMKPKELYEKIQFEERSNVAVLVLETLEEPSDDVIEFIANECKVTPSNLRIVLVPTSSVSGSTQISGRIVETGIHQLSEIGLDPKLITHGCGYAPIAPVHPKFKEAMGRTNDMIMYGGVAYYTVSHEDDEKLRELVEEAPSSTSKSYGKPFIELFEAAGYDFYKIDPGLFAPAVLIVNNTQTGSTFKAGKIDVKTIKRSIGLE